MARFGDYAAAFEEVVASDDWSKLEPFFAEDAVYVVEGGEPFEGSSRGRRQIFEYLKGSLDGFDRRFERRELELLDGPALRSGAVWMRWRASYKSPGLPELVIDGEESVTFEGDLIVRMEDHLPPPIPAITEQWFRAYGDLLPPARE